jgi:hypothetical protein
MRLLQLFLSLFQFGKRIVFVHLLFEQRNVSDRDWFLRLYPRHYWFGVQQLVFLFRFYSFRILQRFRDANRLDLFRRNLQRLDFAKLHLNCR